MDKLDSIFREQLENHRVAHRAELWDILSEQLDRRNKRQFLVKSAAAVILLCVCGFSIVLYQPNKMPVLVEKETVTIEPIPLKIMEPKHHDQLVFNSVKLPRQINIKSKPLQQNSTTHSIAREDISPVHLTQKSNDMVYTNHIPNIKIAQKAGNEIKYTAIYSATETTSEDQSFLDKVFATAIDIKNGELDWNLRGAKNRLVDKVKNLN